MKSAKKLRTGFTTGACAAATTKAAALALLKKTKRANVPVIFPDGKTRRMTIAKTKILNENSACATIIKDAGDDPDVTNGALLSATISRESVPSILPQDFVLKCGKARVILRGGAGVGKVTRPGLDVPVGKWAINPVPRKMILENLTAAGCGKKSGDWLVVIEIKDGAKLARKTLNATVGVRGGLSILGTSGIVVPYSHRAYIDTIKILLKGARVQKCRTAVLTTGGRTLRAARKMFPRLAECAFVRVADYIGEAMKFVAKTGFEKIKIVCMPGKFYKLAQGQIHTHAAAAPLSLNFLRKTLKQLNEAESIPVSARTVRHALEKISPRVRRRLFDAWGHAGTKHLKNLFPSGDVELVLVSPGGQLLGKWK